MQSANKHKNERGVVLILAALLMSVILAFVALAVDIARLASIQSEKLFTADSASLGALQAYIQSPPGTSHPDRLTRAFNRAETVTGFNFSTLGNHAQQAGAGELSSSSAGELLAGRSWIVRPPSCILPGCPCNLPINQVTDGCFQVCDADGCPRPDGDVSKPKLFATAISLELRTQGGGESRNALGSIIGAGSTPIRAKSFAASRSSHGIILLDVSSSTKLDGTTPLQPLTNIVNLAAAIYDDVIATGDYEDELGFIAFDSAHPANTTFPLTPVSNGLVNLGVMLHEPLVPGSRLYPRNQSNVDLPRALQAALTELKSRPDSKSSFNHVILITTGLTNCQSIVGGDNQIRCQNSQLSNQISLQEATNIVKSDYASAGVILSISLAGKDVLPHTVLLRQPGGTACMNTTEKRRRNFLNVIASDSDAINLSNYARLGSGNANYLVPSAYLYGAVAATGGKWLPVRPGCSCVVANDDCSAGPPTPEALANSLDTAMYTVKNGPTTDSAGRKTCGDDGCIRLDPSDFARTRFSDLFDRTAINLISPN